MKKWYSKNDIKKTAKKSIWDAYGPKMDPKSGPTGWSRSGPRTTVFESGDPLGSFGEPYGPKTHQRASKTPQNDDFLTFLDQNI